MITNVRFLCILFLLFQLIMTSFGQLTFDVNDEIFPGQRISSGLPMAVVDIDGDYLDDIVFLEQGSELYVGYQIPSGGFDKHFIGATNGREQWAMAVGDLDKNGWRDIVVCGAFDWIWIYYQDANGFERKRISIRTEYAQGTNLVDIDGDGWLDIHMCNDVGSNLVLWNEQDTFSRDTSGLFAILSGDDAQGNYSSEWADIDSDGDLDLYVSKCFANANDPTDLRRKNQLFIQGANGVFTEEAEIRGVSTGEQSWTGHFYDADNDLDFDLLVTNHNSPAQLFTNDGEGFFTETTRGSGLNIRGPVIQCFTADFNMDGYLDIAGGNIPDFVYISNGLGLYTQMPNALGQYDVLSMACGDLNRDHHADLFGSVGNLINLPSTIADRTMKNPWSKRNYFTVYLQGSQSNYDGVGAKVELYYPGGQQIKNVQSGQSYGIQNSYQLDFGIGVWNGTIDSCVVRWPSGQIQKIESVESNQFAMFWEDHTVIMQTHLGWGESHDACDGDTVQLEYTSEYEIIWQNMISQGSLEVTATGLYQATLRDSLGQALKLPSVWIEFDRNPEGSIFFIDGDTISCEQDARIDVQMSNCQDSFYWSKGGTGELEIAESGIFKAIGVSHCAEVALDSIIIELLSSPEWLIIKGDTVPKGEAAQLVAHSDVGEVRWYVSQDDTSELYIGDTLIVANIQKDTIFWAEAQTSEVRGIEIYGEKVQNKVGVYPSDIKNPRMVIDVKENYDLESAWVYTDTPGIRLFDLRSRDRTVVAETFIDLDTGWNQVVLNFALNESDSPYDLGTRDSINMTNIGTRSPRLWLLDKNIEYPYGSHDWVILESSDGYGTYDYFFDLQVRKRPLECLGERIPVAVKLDSIVSNHDFGQSGAYECYPNPSIGTFEISTTHEDIVELGVYQLDGRALSRSLWHWNPQSSRSGQLNIQEVGTFVVKIGRETGVVVVKK